MVYIWFRGGCGRLPIGRSAVQFPAPPVRMSMYAWARYLRQDTHQCVNGGIDLSGQKD